MVSPRIWIIGPVRCDDYSFYVFRNIRCVENQPTDQGLQEIVNFVFLEEYLYGPNTYKIYPEVLVLGFDLRCRYRFSVE